MTEATAAVVPAAAGAALGALRRHWPEYAMEAAGLGAFMISACLVTALLEHPASPVRRAVPDPLVRRIPMGLHHDVRHRCIFRCGYTEGVSC